MVDRLLQLQTEMVDKIDEFKEEMLKDQRRCEATVDNYNAQLSELQSRQKDAQTLLAEAVTAQTQNEEQSS